MSTETHIEWTDATWNIVTGCTRVSSGCDRCYIERTMPFRTTGRKFDKPGIGGTTGVQLHPERLDWPLRWRKPRKIFVPSLADLWHKDVPDDLIVDVFAVMALTPQHIYQNPTKRPARMRSLLNSAEFWYAVGRKARHLGYHYKQGANYLGGGQNIYDTAEWETRRHLDNVWLGVSTEDQETADLRIPALLDTPAAVRFLSCEPLLGPVDLSIVRVRNGTLPVSPLAVHYDQDSGAGTHPISWVIVGGESGSGARPMHPDWARTLRDQCNAAGVAFFFKQFGAWAPWMSHPEGEDGPGDTFINPDGETGHVWFNENLDYPTNYAGPWGPESHIVSRVGKKAAGRVLDGRVWDEFPPAVTG